MKQKKTNLLILLSAIICLNIPAFSQDLSVFDIKLNESFNIPECRSEITEIAVLGNGGLFRRSKKVNMYKYSEAKPATGKCFQRVGFGYTKLPDPNVPASKNLPPVLPVTNGKVKLVYADNLRPSIALSEDIWIGIENSKLTGIRFYFPNLKANDIFQVITKKYGKASAIEDLYIQNGIGGRKEFYKAKWEFAKLSVTFLSLDTNEIGYDPADPYPAGYNSNLGSLTIQYKTADGKVKDINPL